MRPVLIPAFAVAAVFLVTGCTSQGLQEQRLQPDPTPITRPDCDPGGSEITWQPKLEGEDAALGFQVHSVDDAGRVTTEDRLVDYKPRVSRDGAALSGDQVVWVDALVEDYARTGQASGDLGPPPPNFDNVEWEPEGAGVWVAGYWTTQVVVPFAVECDGGRAWTGELELSEGDENGTVLVQCGFSPPDPVSFTDEALSECPPA